MRKLLTILATSLLLATMPAAWAQSTVPMVMTISGNGTITGSGISGTLVAHSTYSTWTLNVPALNWAGVEGILTGSCSSTTVVFGNGT